MASTDTFPLTLPYGVETNLLSGVLSLGADSGRSFQSLRRADRRVFHVRYLLTTDELEQLRDWYARFRGTGLYFVFLHPVWVNNAGAYLARKFPVEFAAEPRWTQPSNDVYDAEVSLVESVGRALQSGDYPDPTTGHPSFFIEEDHPQAAAVVGTWTAAAQANAHAGNEKTNLNTNTTDKFRFTYAGYGFRLWARKASNLGILQVFLDGVSLGNVDLYNASSVAAAALLTKLDATLGLHTVDLAATNTRNGSSSANTISGDAVEVMP